MPEFELFNPCTEKKAFLMKFHVESCCAHHGIYRQCLNFTNFQKKKKNKSLPCTGVGEYLVFDLKLVSQKCYPLFKITFRGSEFQNLRINYFFAIIIPVEEHTNE